MKSIKISIDEETGETTIEANGYARVNGQCQGEKATEFIEQALGGITERQYKPDFEGGRSQRQNTGARAAQQ